MGLEADCWVHHGGERSEGKARLEHKDLYFQGEFRLKIPLAEINHVEAKRGELRIRSNAGETVLELGSREAQQWYQKIRYPRKLLDKLGVKPEHRVSLAGVDDPTFLAQLEDRAREVKRSPAPDSDMIFLAAEETAALDRLPDLRRSIKPAGAIWVLWPKGRRHIKEGHVRGAAKSSGLVDVKVVSFSQRLSGLKLMIPRDQR